MFIERITLSSFEIQALLTKRFLSHFKACSLRYHLVRRRDGTRHDGTDDVNIKKER